MLLFVLFFSMLQIAGLSQTNINSTKPDIQIKVRRDTGRNFVSYDSTVVVTWHSGNGAVLNSDSIYKKFFGNFVPFYEEDTTFSQFFDLPSNPNDMMFDMEKEFRRMDEMFSKQMQMMLMQDFQEILPPQQEKNKKSHNKKTSGKVNEKLSGINMVKI